MSRFLEKCKAAFSSPDSFGETLETTNDHGEVRYNKDLLPSPPGKLFRP